MSTLMPAIIHAVPPEYDKQVSTVLTTCQIKTYECCEDDEPSTWLQCA